MKMKQIQPLTPAALYAGVSSDRQDLDLSVSAQLRALKEYASANGYSVAREYIDEAEAAVSPTGPTGASPTGASVGTRAVSTTC